MDEMNEYVLRANNKEQRKLNKQRDKSIKEARRVQKMLNKKKVQFRKEIKFIEVKMIPYITRQKWMPPSYCRMLDTWEDLVSK